MRKLVKRASVAKAKAGHKEHYRTHLVNTICWYSLRLTHRRQFSDPPGPVGAVS